MIFLARGRQSSPAQPAVILAALLLAVGILAPAQPVDLTKRGILPEDYFSFELIGDPHISPDGTRVAYVVTTVDRQKNRRASSIWLVPAGASAPPRRLTTDAFNSSSPRWSPDGKTIAFVSTRASNSLAGETSGAQVFVLPMIGGGEAIAVTGFKSGVHSFQWSPDGTRIVAVALSGPSDSIAAVDRKSDVRHYKHIQYKFNDTGWYDDKRLHLWVIGVATGQAKQVTEGDDWNDTDPQWSPDGTHIAFVSDRTGKAYDGSRNTDVWVIDAGGGSPIKISDHEFEDENPRWSPDGNQILFTGKTAVHQFAKLYVADARGGSASQLALNHLDLMPTELKWPASRSILFAAVVKGEAQLFQGDPVSHTFAPATSGPRNVHEFDVHQDTGQLVYLASSFRSPDDLYISNFTGKHELRLTHLNTALWARLDLQPVERLRYESKDRLPVDGFLVKPVGWMPGKKYPMVLVIHGGPRDMFGVGWYHEFHVYSAKGWAVFFCNPRGSTGYGEEFERGEINNWGLMDYQDVLSGVDAALEKYPWIDPQRLGVTGGSYGGFMTNWIISHTDRFKAAVTLRSLSNLISDEGTRDGAYGHEEYFKNILFDDFDRYWEASPLKHARNVHTPTLILHSENDFRLPIEQGEQWFRALRHYGVPAELVVFPRENHNLTRTGEPKHLVETLNWQVYWFDRYLNGNANAKPPDEP